MNSLSSVSSSVFTRVIRNGTVASSSSAPPAAGDSVRLSQGPQPPATAASPIRPAATGAGPAKLPSMDPALQLLCGTNEAALKKDLQACLPSARLVWLPGSSPDGVHCGYLADWRDARGEQVARANVGVQKQPDGSLQMIWFDVWLDPEHRDQGFFPRLVDVNAELLTHNRHPETRLELGAGGSGKTGGGQERVGGYLWARLGLFEFQGNSRERMAAAFDRWLERQAQQHPELTPELREQLRHRCREWKPDQFADFDLPFLKLPVARPNGQTRMVALGKAFLMDAETPGWHGSCKINQVDPDLLARARRAFQFGGREVEQAPPIGEAQLAATLLKHCADGERPLSERYHAAQLWTMLSGQADPQGLAGCFADVFPPERYLEAYAAASAQTNEPGRVQRVLLDLDKEAYGKVIADYEKETGRPIERQHLQRLHRESGGYPHKLAALLRAESEPQKT